MNNWSWNPEQLKAIQNGVYRRSFCMIGAAGTGKTTTLKGTVKAMLENHVVPMLKSSTNTLIAGTPGIAFLSYTRRAVRNIARQMSDEMKGHCLTVHKILEYAPEYYDDYNEEGELVQKMRFAPQRNRYNPLPAELTDIVIDEASMLDVDLYDKLIDALPNPEAVRFIFLGDLNQLPPVYGQSILGIKLLELEIVELTRVYRQALESPIIALALAVKNNHFAEFNKNAVELWNAPKNFGVQKVDSQIVFDRPGRGKVTLIPWKKRWDPEFSLKAVKDRIPVWCEQGFYNPEEDLILCPWNNWCDEINLATADYLGRKRDVEVHQVIAGYQTYYLAVGDKLMVDKQDCIILDIYKNPKYLGKRTLAPSKTLNRWGKDTSAVQEYEIDNVDIDDALAMLADTDVTERTAQASHIMKIRVLDTEEEVLVSTAAVYNASKFGYAITVHKAQGSECRRVFFITDYCHAGLMSRELVYTGITRAAEELVMLMSPQALAKAAAKPRIKGDTLAEKLEFFTKRNSERMDDNG